MMLITFIRKKISLEESFHYDLEKKSRATGPMARRLTTNQEVAGLIKKQNEVL